MQSKGNNVLWVVLVIAIVLGIYFFTKSDNNKKIKSDEIAKNFLAEETPMQELGPQIIYSDVGYSPQTLTIKKGETVIFSNQSSQATWPASAMHPTHRDYPTTGGCLGSTFDACRGLQPNETWTFTFDFSGDWKYHDHLHPSNYGTIIVEE